MTGRDPRVEGWYNCFSQDAESVLGSSEWASSVECVMFSTNKDYDVSHKQKVDGEKRVAQMFSTNDYLRWSRELLDNTGILQEIWPALYTPRPSEPACMHCQFRDCVCLHASGRVRTSTTIMIVHISYAGQGLKCNSQEQALPPTSIKKNQSAQDQRPRCQVERQ